MLQRRRAARVLLPIVVPGRSRLQNGPRYSIGRSAKTRLGWTQRSPSLSAHVGKLAPALTSQRSWGSQCSSTRQGGGHVQLSCRFRSARLPQSASQRRVRMRRVVARPRQTPDRCGPPSTHMRSAKSISSFTVGGRPLPTQSINRSGASLLHLPTSRPLPTSLFLLAPPRCRPVTVPLAGLGLRRAVQAKPFRLFPINDRRLAPFSY